MAKSPAQLSREIAEVLARLTHADGTRNPLGKLLASIARTSPTGLELDKTPGIEALVNAGYITYGLHPRGGYRASVTAAGLDALSKC